MPSTPLGIGVIGAGAIVKRHVIAYQSLPSLARLVAVADIDAKRSNEAKAAYGFAEALTDYRSLLSRSDVDVVDICAPAGLHCRMVVDALKAGKHVLCEKPIATTLADADAMIAAAAENAKLAASCVFQLRCETTHRRMRRLIQQGQIGRPLLAKVAVKVKKSPTYYTARPGAGSWKVDGGGVLINQAIHQLDALISFLGEPVEASATMETFVHPIDCEDTLTGWVRFQSGALATIECTTCAKKKECAIEITGENAGLRIAGDPDAQNFDLRIDAPGSAARKAILAQAVNAVPEPKRPNKLISSVRKLVAKSKKRPFAPSLHFGHTPFVKDFLEAVRDGKPAPVTLIDARAALALATALYESARTRHVVHWPVDGRYGLYNGPEGSARSAGAALLKQAVAAANPSEVGSAG